MLASLLHFVLIHQGAADKKNQPRALHFTVDADAVRQASSASSPADLLVIDSRRMSPVCVQAAFEHANRLRGGVGFRHGVLVCDVPLLPLVVGAMRAGLRDIIHEPITTRQLVKMLRAASPERRAFAPQAAALVAIMRTVAGTDRPAGNAVSIARREYALMQRAEKLANMETRLTLERAALEDRDQKLRASTRRLESEFAALQKDTDVPRTPIPEPAVGQSVPPFVAVESPFATDLQSVIDRLSERARALDIRERMLQEMETLLLAQQFSPAYPAPALRSA